MSVKRVRLASIVVIAVIAFTFVNTAVAQGHYKILYTFGSAPGAVYPHGALVRDGVGNLYGTSNSGGSEPCTYGTGCGTVFRLAPQSDGSWSETVLYSFLGGDDGYYPVAGLVMDATGTLYGTTEFGGISDCGIIFKLTPNVDGSWTKTTIYRFSGADGALPMASMIFDGAGNLYGTTAIGGPNACATVFKLSPNSDGSWSQSLLHAFALYEGCDLESAVAFDASGNLYGAALTAGPLDDYYGAVFQLTPNSDGSWSMTLIYRFKDGKDGANPGPVVVDATGTLYGTASGWNDYGLGTVYKLKPNSDGTWTQTVLHTFTGYLDGGTPGGLIFDSHGYLYGTTIYGGASGDAGTVFRMKPNTDGTWTGRSLHQFGTGLKDGANPNSLISDPSGNFYGTTPFGGSGATGILFELIP